MNIDMKRVCSQNAKYMKFVMALENYGTFVLHFGLS